jgi:Transposase DDE domain group 1
VDTHREHGEIPIADGQRRGLHAQELTGAAGIEKEGKLALRWTRLSCHAFRHNAVRLQLFALAYNLANFLRSLALPDEVAQWSLTTLREELVKIGARIVRHGRYVVFQLAEVAVPRSLFAQILRRIDRLRESPAPAT